MHLSVVLTFDVFLIKNYNHVPFSSLNFELTIGAAYCMLFVKTFTVYVYVIV